MEKEIYKILEAPMRANISTSDIRVSAMSTTGLGEKVSDLKALFLHELESIAKEVDDIANSPMGTDYQLAATDVAIYQLAATDVAILIRSRINELL